MIWTLEAKCVSGMYLKEECVRIIEIESESSLYDLHEAIQDAVGFDRDHLFEFFGGRNWRNRKLVIEEDSDWEDSQEVYANVSLEQIFPLR